MLRNIEWYIPINSIEQDIIERRVLEAIGCDKEKLLLAAADYSRGVVDMNQALPCKLKESNMNLVAAKSHTEADEIFHHDSGTDEDFTPEEKIYVELGEDNPIETDRMLENALKEAQKNGISKDVIKKLRVLGLKYSSLFE